MGTTGGEPPPLRPARPGRPERRPAPRLIGVPVGRAPGTDIQTFRDIVVTPSAAILHKPRPFEAKTGPIWPDFETQIDARHCRGPDGIPFDTQPDMPATCDAAIPEAAWCGPVCNHFGHAIADFSTRIAVSADRLPGLPLLFSALPGNADPPDFFWGIIDQFGVPRDRVLLVAEPLRVGLLHVAAQAERLQGPPPEDDYLDLLDRTTRMQPDPALAGATVYLSRSRFRSDSLIGRIAGEAYFDDVMARAGALVVHPEQLPLAEQLRLYRGAGRLVFSEGSALHALQLLGRLSSVVIVLARRPRYRMASGPMAKRVRRVHWVETSDGVVHGVRADGRRDIGGGLTVMDDAAMLPRFAVGGLDLAPHWNHEAYREACLVDVNRWIEVHWHRRRKLGLPAADAEEVARTAGAIRLFDAVRDRLVLR